LLTFLSDIALSHATTDVDEHNTVVTVPIDFGQEQRKEMTKAAELAGFKVVQARLLTLWNYHLKI
jgi:molecular chaperone DnaK (HSP70)